MKFRSSLGLLTGILLLNGNDSVSAGSGANY